MRKSGHSCRRQLDGVATATTIRKTNEPIARRGWLGWTLAAQTVPLEQHGYLGHCMMKISGRTNGSIANHSRVYYLSTAQVCGREIDPSLATRHVCHLRVPSR